MDGKFPVNLPSANKSRWVFVFAARPVVAMPGQHGERFTEIAFEMLPHS